MKAKKTKPVASVDREMRWVRQAMEAERAACEASRVAAAASHTATIAYNAAQEHTKRCREALTARVDGKRMVVVTGNGVVDWTPGFKFDPNYCQYCRVQS